MRALIADDDRGATAILAKSLGRWNFDVTVAHDGGTAWDLLAATEDPSLAILDWMMPTLDGLGLCRRIRQDPARAHMYVILLTGRDSRADLVAGLDAGADDYLIKPFDLEELRARVHVGIRVLTLQERLAARVIELRSALANVKQPAACFRFAATASASAATRITGSRWTATSRITRTSSSAMGSVRRVSRPCAPTSSAARYE